MLKIMVKKQTNKHEVTDKIKHAGDVAFSHQDIPKVGNATYRHREVVFYLLIACIIAGFSILTYLVKNNFLLASDLLITLGLQSINNSIFTFVMQLITFLGNRTPGIIVTAVVCFMLWWHKRSVEAVMTLVSTIGAAIIGILFKTVVARPRPDPTLIQQSVTYFKDDSFPSGHVLFYVGLCGFLLYIFYTILPNRYHRTSIVSFLLGLLSAIGISRIYLGAHWFSDVLGAYLIGFIWLTVVVFFYNKLKSALHIAV